MAYSSFINFLFFSKTLHLLPHLYRTSSPFHYLYGPLIYFFTRYTLEPKIPFKKSYYFHFIPFIINFCELIPTFALSTREKLTVIFTITDENFLQSNMGLLNTQQHLIVKSVLYFIYCSFSTKLLLPILKKQRKILTSRNQLILSWLIFDTFSKGLLSFLDVFFILFNNNCIPYLGHLRCFFYGFEMLISMFYLIFNPKLLVGVKYIRSNNQQFILHDLHIRSRKKKQNELILIELIKFMELNEVYKQKINSKDIAESLKISNVKLARIINENYDLSFTDFINNYRLLSIDNQILEKKHLIYSLEYIAYEAGFHSKNAFYVAFKKLRNTTPGKYYNLG
jgi:AraC-like DNA-binding protein